MNTTINVHTKGDDQPHVVLYDAEHVASAFASVQPDTVSDVSIFSHSPDYLRRLARTCDEAAERLSAALDVRAARDLNQQAGAA